LIFGVAIMVGGLTISYYLDWPPGATIVSLSVLSLILTFIIKGILILISKHKKANK